MVQTASGCCFAIGRISSASFAAAARASLPCVHRSGAGVRFLPVERDGVALDALGSQNDS